MKLVSNEIQRDAGPSGRTGERRTLALVAALPDIPSEDWDLLFHAVESRLRSTVTDRWAPVADLAACASAARIRAGVLESVAALELLHVALMQERQERAHLRNAMASACRSEWAEGNSFSEQLHRTLSRASGAALGLGVLQLKLDDIRTIQDSHGPDVGEALLHIIAARLSRALRAEDSVSRAADDAFACLLVDVAPGRIALSHLACRLFDVLSAPIRIDELTLTVRPSIGIAIWPEHGATATTLLESVAAATEHAHRHQTGYAFFDERCGLQRFAHPLAIDGVGAAA